MVQQRSHLFPLLVKSVVFWTLLLSSAVTVADENSPLSKSTQAVVTPVTQDEWDSFQPPRDDKFDWLQFKSGEWLKGELVSLYYFEMEFDSDELDLLEIELEDVRQIRSARPMSLKVQKNLDSSETMTVIGILQLKDNTAVLLVEDKVQVYERAQIISIAKASDKIWDLWTGKFSLGANIKRGNTDIADINLNFNARRLTSESRLIFDYVANLSRTDGVETSNNNRVNSYYDIFYNSRFFWRTYLAEYYRDTFKNIDQQVSLGSGGGYHLIRTAKTEWDVSGGLGAIYKRFVSVGPGEEIDNTSPFLQIGTTYDTEATKWMDFIAEYKIQFVDEDNGSYISHLQTTLSTDLTKELDVDITLVWDRIEDPQASVDSVVPKQDDYQLIVSVSYEF